MTKKSNKKKSTKKSQQMKIAGTGRIDAIDEIETASEAYRNARDARMAMQEEELELQGALTSTLKKHDKAEYKYEGPDGRPYVAYQPSEKVTGAKVRLVKETRPDMGDGDE